jgi:hypothetical protein
MPKNVQIWFSAACSAIWSFGLAVTFVIAKWWPVSLSWLLPCPAFEISTELPDLLRHEVIPILQ